MNRIIIMIIMLFCTTLIVAQDKKQEDINFTDKKDNCTYTLCLHKEEIPKSLTVDQAGTSHKFKMPKKIGKIKWVEVKPGVWIDKKTAANGMVKEFDGAEEFRVHYSGYLLDGTKFDSSFDRRKPLEGKYSKLIPGFSLGMANIPVGKMGIVKIAPEMGYKDRDLGIIPPNSTLIFYIYNIGSNNTAKS